MERQKRIGGQPPDRARSLRRTQTEPEQRLWKALRNRQLANLKFRRQAPIGAYVADFLCVDVMLIVEVDGDTHASTQAQDARRTAYLESEGFRVIRYSNTEIVANIDGVLADILTAAQPSPSHASGAGPSLSRRERDL
jgi:very-short-patch-repair endonuclease